ncbi:MAG TPA: FxsB family cyclophane-forming radical SAM/SPASM peptide maturase [Actinocrinis sp.]|nr:FxsB family cyclophane-forming radical SAM/SPASM peptide maturase [Actinocrinis sp.]
MPAFTQFVLKVASRCDLACDHCYVYEHADQSWRSRPGTLAPATAARAAQRVAEHAAAHGIPQVHVVLHGGEPLLLGPARMAETLGILRETIAPVSRLDLRLHTNAVRLSGEFCDVFREYGVKVGVSLDGGVRANDLHRRFADGRSSHSLVLEGLKLLRRPEYRRIYAGILCTIDTRNDPVAVYEALVAEDPPHLDFLLPHATWAAPPPRHAGGPQEYARWLLAVYERWRADGRPVPIRTFVSAEASARGGRSLTEALGADAVDLVVIETDGSYEQVDSLKIAYPGAPETGFNVFEHSVDTAAGHPGLRARMSGISALSGKCRACPVVRRCGGGFYPHRYAPENGFDNPSVYCEDLQTLVENIPSPGESPPSPAPAATVEDVGELIDGLDTFEQVRSLGILQNRINRVVVTDAAGAAASDDPAVAEAWDAVVGLDERHPEAAARAFGHVYLRAWAARRTLPGGPDDAATTLGALAVGIAIGSGQAERVVLHPGEAEVYLPDLGTLSLPNAAKTVIGTTSTGLAVESVGAAFDVDLGADSPNARWRPLTRLDAPGLSVTLDDASPHRDCYGWRPSGRLDRAEAAAWQREFAAAIEFLDAHLPHYTAGLRAGLRTIVPLSADPDGAAASGSAWNTFGSLGVARPGDAETLALLLIHEMQHVKLYALLDIAELYDKADRTRYFAPWREKFRPLGMYLNGAYAHTAVTEYWHLQSRIRPPGVARRTAEAEYARWRAHTDDALTTLLRSDKLTDAGCALVERARASLSRLSDH